MNSFCKYGNILAGEVNEFVYWVVIIPMDMLVDGLLRLSVLFVVVK